MSQEIIDVAIVGGGVGGVYTGWRLMTGDPGRGDLPPNPTVHLFELSQRIGGRLLSLTPPEMPNFKAEFGGMRFLTNQPHVRNLVDYFDLPTVPFPVGGQNNIYYLRGQHFREHEFSDSANIPYRLSWLERGKTPGMLIAQAIDTILPGAARLSHLEWQEVKENFKFNGEHLYNLGFWNVLDMVMSDEAYKLVLDAGGYVTAMCNWNAAEALEFYLGDFGEDAVYMKLIDGYESLPLTLADKFVAAGGHIHLEQRLTHFDRVTQEGETYYDLHFSGRPSVKARHVVLAMPRRSLELLDAEHTEFLANAAVQALIPTVTPHPMFKMFMAYRYPWWRDAGVDQGRSITDLPLRQIYYFGSEPDPGRYEAEIMDSLLMASYDDGRFVDFWAGTSSHQDKLPVADLNQSRWGQMAAPPAMVAHAQRQLRLVHDLEYIPEPYAAGYVNWGQDPFGGAWNSWNVRVKAWEVQEKMVQPLSDWQVYICGEAYSGEQGWVEGALSTAEVVLQDKLGLRSPRWLG